MNQLIPTSSKFKLPKDLSYPMGAEEISTQLQDVPQYDDFELTFFESSRMFMSDFKKDLKENKNITVMKITYRPALSGPSMPRHDERNSYGENWSIYVYPVPRHARNEVKAQLIEFGMEKVLKWLSSLALPTSKLVRKQLNIKYDLAEGRINYSEDVDRI